MAAKKKTNKKSPAPKGNQQKMNFSGSPAKEEYKRSVMSRVIPYLLMVLALIFAICLITVGILEIDDGAGIIGFYIQQFLCGVFGGIGAFLIPFLLGFLGVIWCVLHVKWPEDELRRGGSVLEEYKEAKKKVIIKTVLSISLLVVISTLVGVFANAYDSLDLADMWEGAVDEVFEGGLLGSLLALALVSAFEQVISCVILFTVGAMLVIFLIGLTPDYIVAVIRSKSIEAKAARVERAKERAAMEAEEEDEDYVPAAAVAAKARRTQSASASAEAYTENKTKKNVRDMSVDEFMAEYEDDASEEKEKEPEVYIGPSRDQAAKYAKDEKASATQTPSTGEISLSSIGEDASETHLAGSAKDYSDEKAFDTRQYRGIDDILSNLATEEEKRAANASEPINLNQMATEELQEDVAEVAPEEGFGEESIGEQQEIVLPYVFPPIELLEQNKNTEEEDFTEELQENAQRLVETLRSFRIGVSEITYSRGPTITRYELKPNAGIRVRSIANLVDDIALNLAASGVRIEAPIPNKPAVGIEVPNRNRTTVYLRDLIENSKFTEAKSKLTAALGMDVGGNPIYFDIAKMPHMIIAGATGMGKSVCINGIIMSILYKARPEDVKLILVDPKKVEFALYRDIPHLYAPIVSEPKKAAGALASAVAEMERRFELIEEVGVRDIATYNKVTENDPSKEHMPQMVIIIDELADLMMTAPDEVEASICRLAQKARAAGIHIIIGTQRPSVDVITGLIKANIPSRIACTVASQVDSRTIIDIAGAEKLIGRGDMLFAPVGAAKPLRVQGAFVSEKEVESIVNFILENNTKAKYNADFINRIEEEAAKCGMGKKGAAGGGMTADSADMPEGGDAKFRDAVKLAVEEGKISTSLMQRRLGVGYGRAAKIIDTMEELGYVSKPDGNKPRRVILTMDEFLRRVHDGTLEGGASSAGEDSEE